MHFALELLRFTSSQDASGVIETAKEASEAVTDIVFTALERNVLIGVIVLAILGMIAFATLWVRERGALSTRVHAAIEKASTERTADREEMVEGISKLGSKMAKGFGIVDDRIEKVFRDNVLEFKDMREKEQDRNDKKEDLLRDFALNMAQTLNEMKDHFQGRDDAK